MRALVLALAASFATIALAKGDERAYQSTKLDTGLEVVGLESHKVPLVTIVLAVKAGAMTETPDINGLTHLWEHMFFKGNARLPNQEAFNKRIRQLGITYNGDTAAEKVRYFFTLPSAFLDDGLQFMADAISTPLLDQTELEKERRVVLNEYERNAAQPSFDNSNLQRVLIYGDKQHLRDALGQRPVIEQATRDQLFRIKNEVFVPSNSALLVAGDFKQADLLPLVKKHFANWKDPKGWKPISPAAFPPFPKDAPAYVMTRPNVQNATAQLSYNGPKARSEPKDSYAADVLANLLEHRSGKFYKKFVDSGLTVQTGFGYYTQSQAGEIEIYAMTDPANVVKVEDLLEREINEWAKPDYFTQAQVDDVHRNLTINHKRELNQPTEYIKTLAFWWAVTGFEYNDTYLENMAKTGLADVREFCKKWLIGKPHLKSILLSPEDAKKVGLTDTAQPLVDKYLSMYKANSPKG